MDAPTSNTEEAEVERFYKDLQDLLELTPQKDVFFLIGDWNAKVGSHWRSHRANHQSPRLFRYSPASLLSVTEKELSGLSRPVQNLLW